MRLRWPFSRLKRSRRATENESNQSRSNSSSLTSDMISNNLTSDTKTTTDATTPISDTPTSEPLSLEAHSSVDSTVNDSPVIQPRGLANLGNTCFMASALQCLLSIRLLTTYFSSHRFSSEINKNNPLGFGGRLAFSYAKLINEWISNDDKIMKPFSFREHLCQFAPQFGDYQQHDSQELMAFLLDGLHEDLNRCTEKPYTPEIEHDGSRQDEEIAAESWANHLLRNKSVIVDLFQGQLKSTLQCMTCSCISVRFDPFMYLSLPIPRIADATIYDCIDLFSKQEVLEGDNQWYCPKCKQHRDATKEIKLWKIPQVLVVHLKRFGSQRFGFSRAKRTVKVDFPLDLLDLNRYVPEHSHSTNLVYQCSAISEHMGSLHNGHYTATTRHDHNWFHCDDSSVTPIDVDQVCTKHAYLLIYTRLQGSNEIRRQTLNQPELWPHRLSVSQMVWEKLRQKQLPTQVSFKKKKKPNKLRKMSEENQPATPNVQ
eukprot:c7048_g1_i1.p1 GENE.c7048_g1_i1~~c7048_g1_i1.p1  ORF type:complete len:485 (+),score=83.00 c7048_g1_i1:60-1514(+)